MKTTILILFIFFVNGLSAQILNTQPSVLYGTKYFIDNERITKAEFAEKISENRVAGELFMEGRNQRRLGRLLNVVQIGGSIAALYQTARFNLPAAIQILAGTYVVGIGSLYFVEVSENKFRQAILVYNQGIMKELGNSN